MKKALIVSFKVIFWMAFLYNTGIIHFIASSSQSDPNNPYNETIVEKDASGEGRGKLGAQMNQLYFKKVEDAKEKVRKGGAYTPTDYFTDMRDVNAFRKEHGVTLHPFYSELQSLMQQSIDRDESLLNTMDSAREIAIPGSIAWDKKHKGDKIPWRSIGMWWVELYLAMLPWAFILFLLWVYEENDLKKVRVRNPLNFLVSLFLYPVIISLVVRKWWRGIGRQTVAAIEIRRTKKKIFSLFSQDEVAMVQQFAKSTMDLKEFRTLHGKTIHHSFGVAALCAMILVCVPRIATSQPIPAPQTTLSCSTQQSSSEYSGVHPIEKDVGNSSFLLGIPLLSDRSTEQIVQTLYHACIYSYLLSKGHRRRLDHVPLLLTSL